MFWLIQSQRIDLNIQGSVYYNTNFTLMINNNAMISERCYCFEREFDSPHIKFCIPPRSGGKDLVTTKYINY